MSYHGLGLVLLFFVFCSCNSSEGKTKELETKLQSAVQEIKNIEEQKLSDSLGREAEWNHLRDSLRLISSENNQDLSVLYESLKAAVFLVYTSNDFSLSQGSAFLIGSDGICVSNYHVFEGATQGLVMNYKGERFSIDSVISYDKEKDFIVFKISLSNEIIQPLKIANESPRVGEQCFAIGNPRGLSETLSTGIISGFRNNGDLIQTTAEITHGSSGGALFNKKGEVIGITSATLGEANINFAVNINAITYPAPTSPIPNATSNSFVVTSERAYFHSQATPETMRQAYMVRGEMGTITEKQNGFGFVIFKNARGQTSDGWIDLNDISFSTAGESIDEKPNE